MRFEACIDQGGVCILRFLRGRRQAQYLRSVSTLSRRFLVAGATLCVDALSDLVAGVALYLVVKVLFWRIAVAGLRKRVTVSRLVAGDFLQK